MPAKSSAEAAPPSEGSPLLDEGSGEAEGGYDAGSPLCKDRIVDDEDKPGVGLSFGGLPISDGRTKGLSETALPMCRARVEARRRSDTISLRGPGARNPSLPRSIGSNGLCMVAWRKAAPK